MQLQLVALPAQIDVHALRVAVLEHIGQAFLQQPQQVKAAAGTQLDAIDVLQVPVGLDVHRIQQATGTVAQRRQQLGQIRLFAGGAVDHQAQVISHFA